MNRRYGKASVAARVELDEILPEYDFSRARPNKYASRYAAGSIVVVLEPDVAAMFSSAEEANEALRALAGIIQKHRPRRAVSRRSVQGVASGGRSAPRLGRTAGWDSQKPGARGIAGNVPSVPVRNPAGS